MPPSNLQPGNFCWIELATTNQTAAKEFYTALFGWTYFDAPMGPDSVYTMFKLNGLDVAAAYQPTPEQSGGAPPHWKSYVLVANADQSTEKAKSLGGTVVAGPFDVGDSGRMSLIMDPQGALFAIWQAKQTPGLGVNSEPGALCWNELTTSDVAAAIKFYSGLFGWTTKASDTPYTEINAGERPIGGIYKPGPEMPDMPPNWVPYIQVTNCDATAEKAKALGGSVCVGPNDIPNVGRFAGVIDPQGAVFMIIQLTAMM